MSNQRLHSTEKSVLLISKFFPTETLIRCGSTNLNCFFTSTEPESNPLIRLSKETSITAMNFPSTSCIQSTYRFRWKSKYVIFLTKDFVLDKRNQRVFVEVFYGILKLRRSKLKIGYLSPQQANSLQQLLAFNSRLRLFLSFRKNFLHGSTNLEVYKEQLRVYAKVANSYIVIKHNSKKVKMIPCSLLRWNNSAVRFSAV